MNNENSNGGRRTLIEWIFRAVVVAGIGGMFTLTLNTNSLVRDTNLHVARIDERVTGHLSNHPDVGLSLRLNENDARDNDQERRLRNLEIRQGPQN